MLEGVSREAGPFEFVVCADGARVPRTVRVGPDCARGPGTVRAGQWTTGRACPWRWRSRNVRAGQWMTGCAGLELCARASGWARGSVGPFTGSGNPFLRSWALLVAVWAACLGYHLWG